MAVDGVNGAQGNIRLNWQLADQGGLRFITTQFDAQGRFSLKLTGAAERNYTLEISTNLTAWNRLMTNRPVAGILEFVAPATATPRGFYRALTAD